MSTVRIATKNRWDALALTSELAPYQWHLLQTSWLEERRLPSAVAWSGDAKYQIEAAPAFMRVH